MKRILFLLLSALFVPGLYGQELESLIAIMQNQRKFPDFENASDEFNHGHASATYDYQYNTVPEGCARTGLQTGGRKRDSFADKFKGHWAGFEWGLNNFLDEEQTVSREGDAWFMDLNTGRSWVINLNFAQYSLGFGTRYAGLVTGMGLEFNNYFFDNDLTIEEVADEIEVVDLSALDLVKSKLTTTWLRVPLIFEVQFPGSFRHKRAFVSAGVVGGLKLGAHTKVVYKEGDDKKKDKNSDDFNINPFHYGITARIGYGNSNIFFDYYFIPFFTDDKGPKLNPFSIGLSLAF
ncbi:MAG: outer membrane beta-barrel protein [Bacteroidales bacterium]|nr:outer membrane beta-barrel protein [Bacteroidales bacterium]